MVGMLGVQRAPWWKRGIPAMYTWWEERYPRYVHPGGYGRYTVLPTTPWVYLPGYTSPRSTVPGVTASARPAPRCAGDGALGSVTVISPG